MKTNEVTAAKTESTTEVDTSPVISFRGEGADHIVVSAEAFIENGVSRAPLNIADIQGAELAAYGCRDGEFVIDSRNKTKKDNSGDYCLFARLSLRDVEMIGSTNGVEVYSAVLTKVRAYDSYQSDPILETRNGFGYLPTEHRRLSRLAPIQVTVTVTPLR